MSPNSVTHLSEQVLPMSPNTCYLSLRSIHLPHQGGGDAFFEKFINAIIALVFVQPLKDRELMP